MKNKVYEIDTELSFDEVLEKVKKYSFPYATKKNLKTFFKISAINIEKGTFCLYPVENISPRNQLIPLLNCHYIDNRIFITAKLRKEIRLLLILALIFNFVGYIVLLFILSPEPFTKFNILIFHPFGIILTAFFFYLFFKSQLNDAISILTRILKSG